MENNNTTLTRRKVLRATNTALLCGFVGTASAKNGRKNATSDGKIPYDVSITNNGDRKQNLIFTLISEESDAVEYDRQVELPGLNEKEDIEPQSVRERVTINVPTGKEYEATLESDTGVSKSSKWYIPSEGTDHISFRASISLDEEITLMEKVI